MQLRWNAPVDNGAHIQQYVLEYDEGVAGEFVEVIKMKGKQYSLSKLQPSTFYSFRLAAINEAGKSIYSDIVTYSTAGNPPPQMPPPSLQVSTPISLRIAWARRHEEEEYVLHMSDDDSGHGFLTCYAGSDTIHECRGLNRATTYQFKLRAENESGYSPWSEIVAFKTMPERPGRPQKPQAKGKIHATHFKVKWEPPIDKGGADIKVYNLQICSSAASTTGTASVGTFETIYTGKETEANCDRLQPGTVYQVRVSCEGPGGFSMFSEASSITTDAVPPGQPLPPVCGSAPGPYAAVLRWEQPEYTGGAPVTEYELQICNVSNISKQQNEQESSSSNSNKSSCEIIYKGKDAYCVAKDLSPGNVYEVECRAYNRIGASTWSESFEFSTGAAAPFAPEKPDILVRSSTHLSVSWKEPFSNGAAITEYQLASAVIPILDEPSPDDTFSVFYQGPHLSAEVKHLIPFRNYSFKVCAKNAAGLSPYSPIASEKTPAAVPSAPSIDSFKTTPTNVTIFWKQPECNGSPILHYNIDCSDRIAQSIVTDEEQPYQLQYTIENLNPETSYKCKIQAVNEIGASPFSHGLRITTSPLPPKPPKMECTGTGHNFIKLRWADGKNTDFTKFDLQIYNARAKEFQTIYNGSTLTSFKVNKLQEQTAYQFRICSETDHAGIGDYSPEYEFKTTATIPSSIRPPRISEQHHPHHNDMPQLNVLNVEWQHSKNGFADPVEYVLQVQTSRDQEFKQVRTYCVCFFFKLKLVQSQTLRFS